MRFRNRLLTVSFLATTSVGCGAHRPAATTPSANDYVSALAPPNTPAPAVSWGECDRDGPATVAELEPSLITTSFPRPDPWNGPLVGRLGAAWGDAARPQLVLVDAAHGVRVVDTSDPAKPGMSRSLPLPGKPRHLVVAGSRAMLVTMRGHDAYDLSWIDLAAPDGPTLLHRSSGNGETRGAYLVASDNASARVVLVIDTLQPGVACGPRQGTMLRELVVDDTHTSVRGEVALGEGVLSASRRGDFVFTVQRVKQAASEAPVLRMRVVDLAGDPLRASAPFAIGDGLQALHADGRSARVVWHEWHEGANGGGTQSLHIARLRPDSRGELALEASCAATLEHSAIGVGLWPVTAAQRRVLFLPDRTLVQVPGNRGVGDVLVFRDGSCTPTKHALAEQQFLASADGSRLVGLSMETAPPPARCRVVPASAPGGARGGPEGALAARDAKHTLRALLYDPARLPTPLARAEVSIAPSTTGCEPPWDLTSAELLGTLSTTDGSAGRALLAVPSFAFEDIHVRAAQLFTVSNSAIAAGPQLDAMPTHVPASGPVIAATETDVSFYVLGSPAKASRLGSVDAWPTFASAVFVEGGVARLRVRGQAAYRDPAPDSADGQLEFVPSGHDPRTGAAVKSFPLTPGARLARVGSVLVAGVRETSSRPCSFRVFDVRDLRTARETARVGDEALCDAERSLDAYTWHALPHALAFVRAERRHDRGEISVSRFAVFVLDLRDPKHPRWHGPFRTPRTEWALRTFAEETRLFYAYRVPRTPRGAVRGEAHHYLRSIDFADPQTPRFGAPLSVAGEPLFLDADTIYTRDAVWREAPCENCARAGAPSIEHVVRKLARRAEGKAELLASFAVGAREVTAITPWLRDIVLADSVPLTPPGVPPLGFQKTRIAALDARTLRLVGELALDVPATNAGCCALYATGARDVRSLDLNDPRQPRVDHVLPDTEVQDARDGQVLLVRDGALLSLDDLRPR